MLFWARHLLICAKINWANPDLILRWWFWVESPAQTGLVAGGKIQGELSERHADQWTCHLGRGQCRLHGGFLVLVLHSLHSLLALGKWLHHTPRVCMQAKGCFNSQPQVRGSNNPGLPAYISGEFHRLHLHPLSSTLCLQGGLQFNEVLNIKKVSALYSNRYFYENPSLVGTSFK